MLPLLNVPVALMRPVVSLTRITVTGETVKLVRLPPVALRVVVPLMLPRTALIVVVPCASVVVAPLLVIVAMAVLDELQVT